MKREDKRSIALLDELEDLPATKPPHDFTGIGSETTVFGKSGHKKPRNLLNCRVLRVVHPKGLEPLTF